MLCAFEMVAFGSPAHENLLDLFAVAAYEDRHLASAVLDFRGLVRTIQVRTSQRFHFSHQECHLRLGFR